MTALIPAIEGTRPGLARLRRARARFVLFQGAHLALFALVLGDDVQPGLLAVSAALCFGIYLHLLVIELRESPRGVVPLHFYIAASVFRLGIGALYVVSLYSYAYWRHLMVGVIDVSDYLMWGHWLLMLGDLCFLLGYYAAERCRSAPHSILSVPETSTIRICMLAVVFYMVCLILRVLDTQISFGGFGQLAGYFINYGTSASLYILLHTIRVRGIGLATPPALGVWLLFLLNANWSAQSYMKSDIFIALLPVVLVALDSGLERVRRVGLRAMLRPMVVALVVVYIFLFVVSAYSQFRRPDFWVAKGQAQPIEASEVAVMPYLERALLSAVPGTSEYAELHEYPRGGAWGLVSRMSMTMFPAWAYREVQTVGVREGSLFESILVAVTPRLFWPEKPQLSPGADYSLTIGMARFRSEVTSATALTMQGAYFWWGGFPYLILGCFVTGALFAAVWRAIQIQSLVNPISATVMMVLFYKGFHWFEDAFNGAIPFYIYIAVVFLPLQKAVSLWLERPTRTRIHHRAGPLARKPGVS